MNFKIERSLTDQVFTSTVKFDTFGGAGITPVEEQALINDFGAPTIDVGSEEYVGTYSYDPLTKVISEDPAGDEVRFVINSLKLELKDNFETSYSVNAKRVPAAELGKLTLTKPSLVAEAKCMLFEKRVKAKIATALTELKNNMSQFDKGVAETFTI